MGRRPISVYLRTIPVQTVARTSVCRVETRLDASGTAQIRPRHECRGCKQERLRHKNTNSQLYVNAYEA